MDEAIEVVLSAREEGIEVEVDESVTRVAASLQVSKETIDRLELEEELHLLCHSC